MKLEITEYKMIIGTITEYNRITLVINEFDVGNRILSQFTAKGQVLVSTGAGAAVAFGPALDGQTLVWDAAQPEGVKAGTPASGSGETMTARAGTTILAGSVVILKTGYDNSVTTTTIASDPRVHGVAAADIADLADGTIIIKGTRASILVTGAVKRYEWLVSSTTAGRAKGAGFTRPRGAIGIALEANVSGDASIDATIDTDLWISDSAGKAFLQGNAGGSTLNQILDFITDITSGGTALPGVKDAAFGTVSPTTAYITGGGAAAGYKTPFATGTPAACSGIDHPLTTISGGIQSGPSDQSKGFIAGGMTASRVATAYKIVFATETISAVASANLPAAKRFVIALNDTNNGYFLGGETVVNTGSKLVFATEVQSAVVGTNLSSARYGGAGISQIGTKGYYAGGSTGSAVTTTDICTFATDTTANSSGLGTANNYQASASGLNKGFSCGGAGGGTLVEKVDYATNVFSVSGPSALPTSQLDAVGLSTLN